MNPGEKRPFRFKIFRIDAIIAYEGVGHNDHLTAIGRIGENFLITGHAGVENDFALDFAARAKACARKYFSIGQRQDCFHYSVLN